MDIITRRAMMPNDNYIKNGLILWMDGIDKGDVSGTWVDKANGHIFTNVNGMTNGNNYVGLDGSQMQHFKNNTFTTPMTYLGSIEVVISDYATNTMQLIFMPKDNDDSRLGFGIRNSGEITYTIGVSRQRWPIINNAKTFSIVNYLRALENGQEVTITNNYSDWAGCDGNYNYIGYRNYASNYSCFTGKIYSIRIYNRYLSKSEMLHNQRIDNKRFKLGLNI